MSGFCDHEWVVFSTALAEKWLMLQCVRCGQHGTVRDPSRKEWSAAFSAPSHPFLWNKSKRVTVEMHTTSPEVIKEDGEYKRIWQMLLPRTPHLSQDEAETLRILSQLMKDEELDSSQFSEALAALYLTTGQTPSLVLTLLSQRIDEFTAKGVAVPPKPFANTLLYFAKQGGVR